MDRPRPVQRSDVEVGIDARSPGEIDGAFTNLKTSGNSQRAILELVGATHRAQLTDQAHVFGGAATRWIAFVQVDSQHTRNLDVQVAAAQPGFTGNVDCEVAYDQVANERARAGGQHALDRDQRRIDYIEKERTARIEQHDLRLTVQFIQVEGAAVNDDAAGEHRRIESPAQEHVARNGELGITPARRRKIVGGDRQRIEARIPERRKHHLTTQRRIPFAGARARIDRDHAVVQNPERALRIAIANTRRAEVRSAATQSEQTGNGRVASRAAEVERSRNRTRNIAEAVHQTGDQHGRKTVGANAELQRLIQRSSTQGHETEVERNLAGS